MHYRLVRAISVKRPIFSPLNKNSKPTAPTWGLWDLMDLKTLFFHAPFIPLHAGHSTTNVLVHAYRKIFLNFLNFVNFLKFLNFRK